MKKTVFVIIGGILFSTPLYADHAWGTYHWARVASPFDLIVVNSTTSDWDPYVDQARYDWSVSDALNMIPDSSDDTSTRTRRHCPAPTGRIRVCNLAYGNNGWLGIAGIYIDANGHIEAGYTKLNDTYFATSYYNNFSWKQAVTCQETGHTLGLDHQDEDFNNTPLYTCMDYQDPPYPSPNAHDYEELGTIYAHLDGYDSYDAGSGAGAVGGGGDGGGGGGCNAPPGKGCNKGEASGDFPGDIGWGISLGRRGQTERFLRIDPDGTRVVTFVTWAIGY